jgi:hypothetical protein
MIGKMVFYPAPPPSEPPVHNIGNKSFSNQISLLQMFLLRCVFWKDMSEVILNLVPKKKNHNGVRTSAAQEIWLQNYLWGESFTPVPVKS